MKYLKYVIAIVVVTILSKVFIYTYANAISNTVEDYTEWEFLAYNQEINFYYADPNSITKISVEFLGSSPTCGIKYYSYFI